MTYSSCNVFVSRRIAKACVTLLAVSGVMASGIFATGHQIAQVNRQYTELIARGAVSKIDSMLGNAEIVASKASKYLGGVCTPEVRDELARFIVESPHLRVIGLLRSGQLICSSFRVPLPRSVDTSQYVEGRLSLRQGSTITPTTPYLVLLSAFSGGSVSVSISMSDITDALSLLSIHSPLTLKVGGQSVSGGGTILPVRLTPNEHTVFSTRYPFSVEYAESAALTPGELFEKGRNLLVFFCTLGFVTGFLIWKYSFRPPTFHEQVSRAIECNQITPWYQPVIFSRTGEIHGVEVLARWKNDSGTFIPPDLFIALAERNGLIIPLTSHLMKHAASDLAPVIAQLQRPFHIAFNISAAHINGYRTIIDDYRRFVSAFPEKDIQLVAEITEREPFEQSLELESLLEGLRNEGVKISLDDFGTGYSNLRYLSSLPVNYIKIDRSFINHLNGDERSDKIVECVIGLADSLEMGVIAEGVETLYQVNWLKAHEVEFLQGYYFSPPLPGRSFVTFYGAYKSPFTSENIRN